MKNVESPLLFPILVSLHHEELTKWKVPFTARSNFAASFTTFDGGADKGYMYIPQVEHAIAVHLFPHFQGM